MKKPCEEEHNPTYWNINSDHNSEEEETLKRPGHQKISFNPFFIQYCHENPVLCKNLKSLHGHDFDSLIFNKQ